MIRGNDFASAREKPNDPLLVASERRTIQRYLCVIITFLIVFYTPAVVVTVALSPITNQGVLGEPLTVLRVSQIVIFTLVFLPARQGSTSVATMLHDLDRSGDQLALFGLQIHDVSRANQLKGFAGGDRVHVSSHVPVGP